jgi:hypothetical protein
VIAQRLICAFPAASTGPRPAPLSPVAWWGCSCLPARRGGPGVSSSAASNRGQRRWECTVLRVRALLLPTSPRREIARMRLALRDNLAQTQRVLRRPSARDAVPGPPRHPPWRATFTPEGCQGRGPVAAGASARSAVAAPCSRSHTGATGARGASCRGYWRPTAGKRWNVAAVSADCAHGHSGGGDDEETKLDQQRVGDQDGVREDRVART